VLVAALKSSTGASRAVLRLCLQGRCRPLMGEKLFNEFESVLGRQSFSAPARSLRRSAKSCWTPFLSVCEWVPSFTCGGRTLPDEGDNHLIELAVAGAAAVVVTHNVGICVEASALPQLGIATPAQFLKTRRETYGNDDDSAS